jgi:hypothetical protein
MSAQTAETVKVNMINSTNTAKNTVKNLVNNPNAEGLHEDDSAFYEKDVLSQFRANLNQLEELNARLHFMMNEVAGLVRKK